MPENVLEHIVSDLRTNSEQYFPGRPPVRNVRFVGHTPKPDHYLYDLVVDLDETGERVSVKVYRQSKHGTAGARNIAKAEYENLSRVYQASRRKKFSGVPRPIGNFSDAGAVVSEKFSGLPLQSLIMKAALLPGFSDGQAIQLAATKVGEWLRAYHRALANPPEMYDFPALLDELENLCTKCRTQGLDDNSISMILAGSKNALARSHKSVACSCVLNDFTPLNVLISDHGVGVADYARMGQNGFSLADVATFLAGVEALERYPFCNRRLTKDVQAEFLRAYGLNASEQGLLRVLKIRALLKMFAQGRGLKESAIRKKVMWANIMKRFLQQAAERSLASAA
jgi:hypothetical protein